MYPMSFLATLKVPFLMRPGLRHRSPDTLGHAKSASPKMAAEASGASCGALVLWCRVDGHAKGWNCGTDCGTVMKIKWPGCGARWSESFWVILSHWLSAAIMTWKVNHEKLGATAGRCRIYFLFISAWPWRTMKHIKPIPLAYPWCQGSTASVGWLFGCPCSVAFWHADQGFLCEPKQVEPFAWLGQGLFHEKGDAGE